MGRLTRVSRPLLLYLLQSFKQSWPVLRPSAAAAPEPSGLPPQRSVANGSYIIRDNCRFTSSNQHISPCFYNGVTIITRIIYTIARFYCNCSQSTTFTESLIIDGCYAIRNRNGSQTSTTEESMISDICYAVRYSNGSQTAAIKES